MHFEYPRYEYGIKIAQIAVYNTYNSEILQKLKSNIFRGKSLCEIMNLRNYEFRFVKFSRVCVTFARRSRQL